MNATQFKKVVQQIVREEIKSNSKQFKPMIKECLGEMLLEQMGAPTNRINNSNKANALREAAYSRTSDEYDEYPTMDTQSASNFSRTKLAEMMGYGDMIPGGSSNSLITVDSAITENGNVVPITPDKIPESVLKAMNRDYSEVVKAWNKPRG